jgi:predicted nuclease of restriction endonuclease-like RecB superfamily
VLTAELVNARRRGSELFVAKLSDETRAMAVDLAARLVGLLRQSVGLSRDEVDAALSAVEVGPRDLRLKDGLAKLLDDRSTWTLANDLDPELVRRELFLRATRARRSVSVGERFDRAAVMAEAARALSTDVSRLERAVFADLRGASILSGIDPISPASLIDAYERSQAQAVLLRAVRIKVGVRCASPAAARALFRRIKFLGLLYTITPENDGYQIVIDGPLSLFESVTKYGQKMAMVLPVLEECEAWTLEADVRWGKSRTALTFRARGAAKARNFEEPPMPDEIAALRHAFCELGSDWRVASSQVVLDVPGAGLLVPDLVFTRHRMKVYFEVLGFWSREAVFRRVELVECGLKERVLFAVSSRLRVSEEVLGDEAPGALYVYKGSMSARAVAKHLDRLASAVLKDPAAIA